jgi:Flp pilus assembly protein TadG
VSRTLLSRFRKDSKAAAAAEMALIMPMMFALMFTTFEGGNYMWTEHKVVKGVRDGARYAGRLPFGSFTCSGIDSAAEANIKNLTRTGKITGGTAKVKGWADDDISVTVDCDNDDALGYSDQGIYTNWTPVASGVPHPGAPHVTVSTVVEYPAIVGLLGFDTSGVIVRAQANAPVTGI